ncbi:MAG: peptidoglycan-associated lipoprotein Pal [Alphaproteobacteria bacterium]|nr:peptidoglycan-associated lipoprotein Pal [Alphaproteobacteria bacterium]
MTPKHLLTALALAAAMGLAGCSDKMSGGGAGGFSDADMIADAQPITALGDPKDPTSVAYLQNSIGDRVYFAVDQSVLTDEARRILNGQADWLAGNDFNVIIEGHADEQGTREYNLALGARRASAVMDHLIAQGVAPARLRTVSYGKERPAEACSEERCYTLNRRAVTTLWRAPGA